MNIYYILTSFWNLEPWVLLSALLLTAVYFYAHGRRAGKLSAVYFTGVGLFILALCSPLDYLGRTYLFSAHMVQHILLLMIVPLLLLIGTTEQAARKLTVIKPIGWIMRTLARPIPAWFLGIGAMWIWHVPSLHSIVLENENLYIAQQISFVLIGLIFWWPVFAPVAINRLNPLVSTLYLSTACLGCTILGILITFAGAGLYAIYINPADTAGILPLLRDQLCITPGVDQQIGGLMMWVPGCLIYLTASMVTVAKWYRSPDEETPAQAGENKSLAPTV